MGLPLDAKLEGTTEWLISNTNKEWITVQRSDLNNLSPFLLTNDWEGGLINQLQEINNHWPRGFRVASDPTLRNMSHSVLIGEISKLLFFQHYNESVLSYFPLYHENLNTTFTLEEIWPDNGLRLPFKTVINSFDREVEPNIIHKINCFRSEDLSLSQNAGSSKPNSFRGLKINFEVLKTLLSKFTK